MSIFNNRLILQQLPGCLAWKDNQLKYQGANDNLLQAMQLSRQEELIGLDDFELNLNSHKMNTLFKQQDLLTLQGQTLEIIHSLEEDHHDKAYLLQKSPLRDSNNKVVGLTYHCSAWSQTNLLKLMNQLDKKHQPSEAVAKDYQLDENANPLDLSKRELECLFLMLRGRTAQQTANVLQLSRRTVESYLDNMKNKFGCLNKSELLVKAMMLGYQKHLPKSLLSKDLNKIVKL